MIILIAKHNFKKNRRDIQTSSLYEIKKRTFTIISGRKIKIKDFQMAI